MERSKYYMIIIVVLFLSNIATLFFSFKMRGMPPRHEGPRDLIIERLHFNKDQISEYDELINWHQKNIRGKDSLLQILKSELYTSINSPETTTDSIIFNINAIQKDIEYIHLKHFKDIEALCTNEQMVYFAELKGDLAKLFGRKTRKGN